MGQHNSGTLLLFRDWGPMECRESNVMFFTRAYPTGPTLSSLQPFRSDYALSPSSSVLTEGPRNLEFFRIWLPVWIISLCFPLIYSSLFPQLSELLPFVWLYSGLYRICHSKVETMYILDNTT